MGNNRLELVGKKFHKLLVIKDLGNIIIRNKPKSRWLCLCDCGREVILTSLHIKTTKSCGCLKHQKSRQNIGFEEISGGYLCHVKHHAINRGLEYNISSQDAWNQFVKQNYRCVFSGIRLIHKKYIKTKNHKSIYNDGDWNASLDRINNDFGYTIDNIQWIHKDIQKIRWDYDIDEFLYWCKLVAENADV